MPEIQNFNFEGMCCEQSCSEPYTHYITLVFKGIILSVPVCERHENMYNVFNRFEHIPNEEALRNNPTVLCEDDGEYYKFFCEFCQKEHRHGRSEGNKGAHCTNKESPYKQRGYTLKLETSEVKI